MSIRGVFTFGILCSLTLTSCREAEIQPEKRFMSDQRIDTVPTYSPDSLVKVEYMRPVVAGKAEFIFSNLSGFTCSNLYPNAYAIVDLGSVYTSLSLYFTDDKSIRWLSLDTSMTLRLRINSKAPIIGKHYIGFEYSRDFKIITDNYAYGTIAVAADSLNFNYFSCLEKNDPYKVFTNYFVEITEIDYSKKVLSGKVWIEICPGSIKKIESSFEVNGVFTNIPFYPPANGLE